MPRLKRRVPSYRLHKRSGQAVVDLNGHDHHRGPYGTQVSRGGREQARSWLRQQPRVHVPRQEATASASTRTTINPRHAVRWSENRVEKVSHAPGAV